MRLHFTIRDLLWLAALVAVCVAWWADHRSVSEQRDNYGAERDRLKSNLEAAHIDTTDLAAQKRQLAERLEALKAQLPDAK